jgi:hypothetical protein
LVEAVEVSGGVAVEQLVVRGLVDHVRELVGGEDVGEVRARPRSGSRLARVS